VRTERPLLFEKYPSLRGKVDWIELGEYPTPVQKMEGLCAEENFCDFYIKRDDLSSPYYGGNKVRKLEFLLAHAKAEGKKATITTGAVGSNHVLANVIHGERLGLETIAVLFPQPNAAYVRKNLLLDYEHGAEFVIGSSMMMLPVDVTRGMIKHFDRESRKFPYFIPPGGSNPRGALGHIDGALELKQQVEEGLLPEPEFIFVTLGSCGTAAGLTLGVQLAGLNSRVIPIRVVEKIVCNSPYLSFHINATVRFLKKRVPNARLSEVRSRDLMLVDDFAGDCYAKFTNACMDAVTLVKLCDGIKLDGTYTGKTMAGALDFVHRYGLEKRPCLFWDTYNSVDLYPTVKDVDYHVLPEEFHKYFETPLQEEEMGRDVVF
jgi:1-aminocyclopropane-1-carboxylate deaminase/D-cysteine desulfhydrase-like pyridoxal-dependent ACC family enzyme